MKIFSNLAIVILIAILLMLAIDVGTSEAHPKQPSSPLSGCPTGTYGSFYNGWRVIVTDNTNGQTLLDITGPANRVFQPEWDALGSNNSTDQYTVQAWVFVTSPAVPGVWLIDTSGLHC